MPWFTPRLTFRNKLLILFLFFSVLPLALVAIFVSQRVQEKYEETLSITFGRNAEIQEQILLYFIESNKSWIRSLTAQDIFFENIDKYARNESLVEDKLLASVNSIRRENPFVEKIYIVDEMGRIIISTATDEIGRSVDRSLPFIYLPMRERKPYLGRVITSSYGKRVIPLSAPFIRKGDNKVIAVLAIELNTFIIRSLFEGRLFTTSPSRESIEFSGEAYIIDDDGYPLTKLAYEEALIPTNTIFPVVQCRVRDTNTSGRWTSYSGQEVFGVVRCINGDDFTWTLAIEQPVEQAFAVSNQLGQTIFLITASVGIVLVFVIWGVARSTTDPIRSLARGADEFGRGNLDYRLSVKTGDELEDLGKSFNEMARQLSASMASLKKEKRELAMQKEAILAERNKLQVIISGIKDAIIAVDLKRSIIIFNSAAEEILGYQAKEVMGKPIDKVIKIFEETDEIPVSVYSPIRKDGYEGVVYSKDNLKMIGKDKKEVYVNLIANQIKEGKNINLGCILTLHDITKEKELEKMKLDFVSMAAHELRTPLTSILGYSSLLLSELGNKLEPKYRTSLHRLVVSAENLGNLIDNLLSVSRIERHAFKVELAPLDLLELVKEAVENFKEQARAKDQELVLEMPKEKLPLVMVDHIRINQVLSNLLINALHYTPAGGKVTVSFSQVDRSSKSATRQKESKVKYVAVSIKDTGIGIPKKALPKLFTKFFRVSGPLERGSKGTGLGLYISKSIIKLHGGDIWVESQLGKGSTFTFTLPVASKEQIIRYKSESKHKVLSDFESEGIIIKGK